MQRTIRPASQLATRTWKSFPLALVLSLMLYSAPVLAGTNQWAPVGPYGGTIRTVAVSPDFANDHMVLTGIWRGLFASSDAAESWVAVAGFENLAVHQIVFSPDFAADRTLFVSGDQGLYRTTDGGATWTPLDILGWTGWNITALALSPGFDEDQTLLAGDANGTLLRSNDGGATWSSVSYGNYGLSNITSMAFATDQEAFFVLNGGLVFKSVDAGATWTVAPLNPVGRCNAIVPLPDYETSGRILFATSLGGKLSSDKGATWSGIPELTGEVFSFAISSSFASDHILYAGSATGVYKSSDEGASWELVLSPGPVVAVAALPESTTVLAAALPEVVKSSDGGQTWAVRSTGILGLDVRDLALSPDFVSDGMLFAATANGGVYRSADRGIGWARTSNGLTDSAVLSLALSPAFPDDRTLLVGTERGGVFKSTDGAANWSAFNMGLDWLSGFQYPIIADLAFPPVYPDDTTLLCASLGKEGVYATTTVPDFWSHVVGLPENLAGDTYAFSVAFSPDFATDRTVFAGFGGMNHLGGVYKSSDGGTSWSPSGDGLANIYGVFPTVQAMVLSPQFSDDNTVLAGTDYGGVFKSTDGGTTWLSMNGDLGELLYDVQSVAFSPDYAEDRTLLLAERSSGVFRNDGGDGWRLLGAAMPPSVHAVAASPDYTADHTLFAGTSRGVYAYTIDDQSAPASVITAPADETFVTAENLVIQGTATDGEGVGVKRVEVSVDGGNIWHDATDDGGARRFATWSFTVMQPMTGTYLIRSRATDNFNNGQDPPFGISITVTVASPSTLAVPVADGDGTYTVRWGASFTPGATYVLEEATNAAFTKNVRTAYSGTALSRKITGRAQGKTYFYRVKATKPAGVSAWLTGSNGCAVPGTSAVKPPASITVPDSDLDGSFSVSWGASTTTGVVYVLEEATNPTFTAALRVAYVGNALTAEITGRTDDTTYYYRVRAVKAGLKDSVKKVGGHGCAVPGGGPVEIPASLTVPVSDSDGSYTVSWGATATVEDGVTYLLEEASNPTFTAGLRAAYFGPAQSAAITGRALNKTYYYRVKAVKAGWQDSGWLAGGSGCAVPGTATAKPPGVPKVPATDADGAYTVTWTASATTGVRYVLEESTVSDFAAGVNIVYYGTALQKALTGRSAGATYYYRVRAVKPGLKDSIWKPEFIGCTVGGPL